MNRRGVLATLLLAAVLAIAGVVGLTVFVSTRVPRVEIPGDFPEQVVRPGVITQEYVSVVAKEWVDGFYNWSVLNYMSRSKDVVASAAPGFRRQMATFLMEQWEVIEAGQQTQVAKIDVLKISEVGNQWAVQFTVEAEPWIGAIRAPSRHVKATVWLSYAGTRPGARSLMQIDALIVESDESDPLPALSLNPSLGNTSI